MELIIEERNKNYLLFGNECIYFFVQDYSELKNNNIMEYLVLNDSFFKLFNLNSIVKKAIYKYIIQRINYRELKIILHNEGITDLTMAVISNQIKKYYDNYKRLLNSKIKNIIIRCNKENFTNGLSLAESLKDKKIIIKSKEISIGDYYTLLKNIDITKYDDFDIKIDTLDSSKLLSLKELYQTCQDVKIYADNISNLNLSTIEKVMYIYDLVKERIYKECPDDLSKSRDIDKVIFGNHIICLGYAKLIKSILSYFDIKSKVIISREKEHAMCLVYIKDKKYNIDGYLAFDPTSDSRESEEDNEYINNYDFFAISVSVLNKSIPVEELIEINIPFDHLLNSFEKNSNSDNIIIKDNIESLFKLMNDNFNFEIIDREEKEKKKNKYELFRKKLFKTKISLDDFITILYNVRRAEYYKGDIDRIDIKDIREASIRWYYSIKGIADGIINPQISILDYSICHGYLEDNEERLISSSLRDNSSIERDMYNMKLIKLLQRESCVKSK